MRNLSLPKADSVISLLPDVINDTDANLLTGMKWRLLVDENSKVFRSSTPSTPAARSPLSRDEDTSSLFGIAEDDAGLKTSTKLLQTEIFPLLAVKDV